MAALTRRAVTIACGVAFLRLYNERHWCNDILVGAGIGILSARIGYWLLPYERKLLGLEISLCLAVLPVKAVFRKISAFLLIPSMSFWI